MEVDKKLLMGSEQLQPLIDILLESSELCPKNILDEEPHPCDQTLALFASLVYSVKIFKDSDAAYETENLSGKLDGWKLLIAVNNTDVYNGYFGAAFVHTGLQQVVVAHRGTDPKCFGAIYTDIQGILRTKYTTCMNSAVTFVDFIRQAINEANNRCRHYTLAITGHSLGAWLTQITAFSVKYLCINRLKTQNRFIKNPEVGIHAKTVGFDSPGAWDMLDKILDNHYPRYAKNVSLDRLDITLYLSAPNRINTSGKHLGRIYRIFIDVSNFTWVDKKTVKYTYTTHVMSNFVDHFKDENRKIAEVLDWAKCGKEYNKLFNMLNWDNNYHAKVDSPDELQKLLKRYQVAEPSPSENVGIFRCHFRIFSENETHILNRMHILQGQKSKKAILNKFVNNTLKIKNAKLLPDFEMDNFNRIITCKSEESLAELCKRLKQLMRWQKIGFTQAVDDQIKAFNEFADLIYYIEGQDYLDSLPKCWLDFEDSMGFQNFLDSDNVRVLCLVTHSGDGAFQISRLWNILHPIEKCVNNYSKYFCENQYTFIGWSQLQKLIKIHGWPIKKDYMMVIDSTSSSISTKDCIELFDRVRSNSMKLVLIVSEPITLDTFESPGFIKTVTFKRDVCISDLTNESQDKLLSQNKVIIYRDKSYKFQEFLGDDCSDEILSSENLKIFATNPDYRIKIKDSRPTLIDSQMPFFKLDIKTSMKFFVSLKSPATNILVVLSGLSREDLETGADWKHLKGKDIILAERDAELCFIDTCKKNPDKSIYLLEVLGGDVYCKEIFNKCFYLDRKFLHRALIDVKKFAETQHVDDLFVITSEKDKELLLNFSKNVHVVTTKEGEIDFIQKSLNKNIHFLNICHNNKSYELEWRYSHGSVESLRSCVSTNSCATINELSLSNADRNLVIITAEPGMGKTTSLEKLSGLLKSPWIIYIELKHFHEHINKLPSLLTAKNVASFLLSKCGSQAGELDLLEYLIRSEMNSRRVVLMLDGFDELEDYFKDKETAKDKIVNLLIFLKNKRTVQIFLTARNYLKESLEIKLSTFSTSFVPIDKKEQSSFLRGFWRSCLSLELGDYGETEEERLEEYTVKVLDKAKRVLGPDIARFIGIPLQLRMLAEVFRPQSNLLLQSPERLLNEMNIVNAPNLYKKFIDLKYNIYFHNKIPQDKQSDDKEEIIKKLALEHGELGFRTFFSKFYDENFNTIEDKQLMKLNRHGLVQWKGNGEFQFVHRTIAEYFCAQMVVHWLNQPKCFNRKPLFEEILIPQILLHPDSKIIRVFMNVHLNELPMSKTALELNAECINQLWIKDRAMFKNQYHQTALHVAAKERNQNIITLLFSGLKMESTQEAFISFTTQYNLDRNTALHIMDKRYLYNSSEGDLVLEGILTIILQYIETCSDETKEKVFFANLFNRSNISKSFIGNYLSSCSSRFIQVFERVKEVELQIKPFTEAIKNKNLELIKEIYSKKLKNNIERYCFLLMRQEEIVSTALHYAVRCGHLDVVKLLVDQTDVPFAVLMAQRDYPRRTPLQLAANCSHSKIVKYFVEQGADINTRIGESGCNMMYSSHSCGGLSTVEYTVSYIAEVHSVDGVGETALHYAAQTSHLPMVKYLVKRGAEINATDCNGCSALHIAALYGQFKVVQYLLQQRADPDTVDKMVRTAITMASERQEWKVVQLLLKWGVDVNADGGKALSWAIWWKEWSIVEALVDKGAPFKESQMKRGYVTLPQGMSEEKFNLSEFKTRYPTYKFIKE